MCIHTYIHSLALTHENYVCVYIYIYIHVCIYVYIHIYIYTYTHSHSPTRSICTCNRTHTHTYKYTYTHTHTCNLHHTQHNQQTCASPPSRASGSREVIFRAKMSRQKERMKGTPMRRKNTDRTSPRVPLFWECESMYCSITYACIYIYI